MLSQEPLSVFKSTLDNAVKLQSIVFFFFLEIALPYKKFRAIFIFF